MIIPGTPAGAVQTAGPAAAGLREENRSPHPASQVGGGRPTGSSGVSPRDSFDRVARLTVMALGRPLASATIEGAHQEPGSVWGASRKSETQPSLVERSLRQRMIDSGRELLIDKVSTGLPAGSHRGESGGLIAWAGFPVRDPDGRIVGALCVADLRARPWSSLDVEVLADLAQVASDEVALRLALRLGSERAVLARTLQQILLPPRLPEIPGLQVAARYRAGGTGAEVLGDFYDVFPSVGGSWGLVVGDVCGSGIAAAKITAFARYTLRGEALRQARPSLILAGLNQAMLDSAADDPRFLTAIYATVRPRLSTTSVRISSAGHPLALIRRSDRRVETVGAPGTLLGPFPDPDLHDTRLQLRAGDAMILYTDGVIEARSHINRELFGDQRLIELLAGPANLTAAQIAATVVNATRTFSGGAVNDDTAVLVLKVP